jgi:alkanesulfonate monooxygenase SsuD/methylene tetrahydromethanopterin reductase-like flavin-dependent oxidoreductase (luciferase family)|tara:strand:+ start:49 stop:1281 length:1233 start_codon:yes stop_codon:yes gene_type:complete
MKTWFFTEDAYPNLPDEENYESVRVNLPNKHFDPVLGADLYNMYLDMWGAADEMGLEIMLNEHHQTATCVLPAAPIALGVLARETKKARLLILGNPIVNRKQPIRVAEEMAYIDVLSRGRLDCGFVRGVPYEIAPANAYPYRGSEKLWEAHDLIMKAWTHHDGPFNFEGRWFHARQVNIWPRPYQQPHPPVWVTMGSAGSAAQVAQRKHIGAVFLAGYPGIRRLFDGYREGFLQAHGEEAPLDRLAYAAIVCVGENEKEAENGTEKLLWYIRSNKVAPQFNNPPGYHPPAVSANIIRGPRPGEPDRRDPRLETQKARGNVFSGTPDQVFQQIKNFWEYSGGFGHLLMMGQAGFMTYDETLKSMKLFTEEVYPRLKELTASYDAGVMKEIRSSRPDVESVDTGLLASEFVR